MGSLVKEFIWFDDPFIKIAVPESHQEDRFETKVKPPREMDTLPIAMFMNIHSTGICLKIYQQVDRC